jgi:alkylation response protein AidB-like acyl-CoA dehydrogenase
MAELGRAQLPSPYFASIVLAATALQNCGDNTGKEWLPQLASGKLLATLVATDSHGQWGSGTSVVAVSSDEGYRLSGEAAFVIDGHVAELVLVACRTVNGLSLFAVDANGPGVRREHMPTLDLTRRQSRIAFADAPGDLVGAEGEADAALVSTLDIACIALAAEQLGGAERCLEMALAYAKERVAFGRPIGGFQAIKHKFADLLVEIEFARSAVDHAVRTAVSGGDVGVAASLANAHCSEMFSLVATENIHIHGGVGFTWEHDAQLFFKRAKSSQLLLGDTAFHQERIAAALLDGPGHQSLGDAAIAEEQPVP